MDNNTNNHNNGNHNASGQNVKGTTTTKITYNNNCQDNRNNNYNINSKDNIKDNKDNYNISSSTAAEQGWKTTAMKTAKWQQWG